MKANATAAPARLRPAWRADAAPVASGSLEVVALLGAEGLSEVETAMDLVGATTVLLETGYPVVWLGTTVLVE